MGKRIRNRIVLPQPRTLSIRSCQGNQRSGISHTTLDPFLTLPRSFSRYVIRAEFLQKPPSFPSIPSTLSQAGGGEPCSAVLGRKEGRGAWQRSENRERQVWGGVCSGTTSPPPGLGGVTTSALNVVTTRALCIPLGWLPTS